MDILLNLAYPIALVFITFVLFFMLLILFKKINGVKKELSKKDTILMEVGEEIKKLQETVLGAIEDHYSPATATDDKKINYQYASRILRSGGTVDEVVDACGVSRSEAELLFALHAK